MPSTYSTDLALELMTTGEDNGTWGTNTNNNLGTLIEQAIVRTGSVIMADADQTISIANGATSVARCFYLEVTGPLTAQRSLTVPTISKPYLVHNNTTGSQSLQVKTAAGTGIVIPNGKTRWLYVNSVNVIDALDSVGALTVGGAFAASSTSAFTGAVSLSSTINKLTITAPATSATLTIADTKTLTASNTLTLAGTDGVATTLPPVTSKIGWFQIGESNPSGATTVDVTGISSSVNHLQWILEGKVNTDGTIIFIQFYIGGVLKTGGSDYFVMTNTAISTASDPTVASLTGSSVVLSAGTSNSDYGFNASGLIHNIQNTNTRKKCTYVTGYLGTGATPAISSDGLCNYQTAAGALTGIRVGTTGGTFTGKLTVLGTY